MIIAVCAKYDNHIQFFKGDDGQSIQKFEVVPKGVSITDVQFSSNSRLLAFACDDASNGILNTMQHKVEHSFQDHDKHHACIATSISLNDNLLASASQDGTVIVRSLKDKSVVVKDKSIKSQITTAKFSPTSNKTLAIAYQSGVVALWDMHAKILK